MGSTFLFPYMSRFVVVFVVIEKAKQMEIVNSIIATLKYQMFFLPRICYFAACCSCCFYLVMINTIKVNKTKVVSNDYLLNVSVQASCISKF